MEILASEGLHLLNGPLIIITKSSHYEGRQGGRARMSYGRPARDGGGGAS